MSLAITKGKEGARQRSFIGQMGAVEVETGAALPAVITAGLKAKHEGLLDGRFDGCHQTSNERGNEDRHGISSVTREKASNSWALSNREGKREIASAANVADRGAVTQREKRGRAHGGRGYTTWAAEQAMGWARQRRARPARAQRKGKGEMDWMASKGSRLDSRCRKRKIGLG